MFNPSPSPTLGATKVGAHPAAGCPPLWRQPKAAFIVGDGEAANIAKIYAFTYRMSPYFYILPMYGGKPMSAKSKVPKWETLDTNK